MTFYVASGVANCSRVNEAAAALAANGHYRTYDWTTHGSVKTRPMRSNAWWLPARLAA